MCCLGYWVLRWLSLRICNVISGFENLISLEIIKDWDGLAQSLYSMSTLHQNKASLNQGRLPRSKVLPKSWSFKIKSTEKKKKTCAPAYSDPRQPQDFNTKCGKTTGMTNNDKMPKLTATKIWDCARFPWWLSGHLWLQKGSLTSCRINLSALKIWHQSNQLLIYMIALLSQSYLSATCALIKEKKESSQSSQSSLYFANWPLNR